MICHLRDERLRAQGFAQPIKQGRNLIKSIPKSTQSQIERKIRV